MLWNEFKKPKDIEKILSALTKYDKEIRIMEICGTHTVSIAKSGIKGILPKNIKLISGPGCPVCVTPTERIDDILFLSKNKDVLIATYGDMIRVTGSIDGTSLEKRKAEGFDIRVVYSPLDAVKIAQCCKDKEVVFIGIGFETTAPSTAIAIERAINEGVNNFSVFSLHKMVEPVLRKLINMNDFNIDGFLCPGNVAVIIGEEGFRFLEIEFKIPSVICGFEAGDIIYSIYRLIQMRENKDFKLENEYIRAVKQKGNEIARNIMNKYFEPCDDIWRGIGWIENSGLKLKDEYIQYDAVKKFNLDLNPYKNNDFCSCGEVIKGKIDPRECKLFSTVCTIENPKGPCMVSSEGACAAAYKYSD
ncbi:Hydrogenase maturation protein HypD [Caloramator quimbayensis]|uniref:Hydrogenase maturation protein HypD n=1 Tax=Caloramator quimbayensis TaxID=1147123 RepID=A0A1T4X0X9_9CLOT|nr:hydrogenase formation protein HypD [Caloramator quimbayensis]SKA83242.1 Hydrogenase maturation protein HypD [Caloramator quimbayensis]